MDSNRQDDGQNSLSNVSSGPAASYTEQGGQSQLPPAGLTVPATSSADTAASADQYEPKVPPGILTHTHSNVISVYSCSAMTNAGPSDQPVTRDPSLAQSVIDDSTPEGTQNQSPQAASSVPCVPAVTAMSKQVKQLEDTFLNLADQTYKELVDEYPRTDFLCAKLSNARVALQPSFHSFLKECFKGVTKATGLLELWANLQWLLELPELRAVAARCRENNPETTVL